MTNAVLSNIHKELSLEGILFVHVNCVPSTMDTVLAEFPYLLENPDKMIAFSASAQTQGRGSHNRMWISRGNCVALSLACLLPGVESRDVELGHVLAVSAVRVLKRLYGNDEFVIKWPNDILLRGLKVGGVLVESHASPGDFQIVVFGIGINVDVPTAVLPERPIWPAGSINRILNSDQVTEDQLRREITVEFYHELASWRMVGFKSIAKAMTKDLMGLNEVVTISFVGDEASVTGLVTGIADNGCLRLRLGDETLRDISSGEIRFQEPTC